MASPVGHVMVGVAAGVVVQRVADLPSSPDLWLGVIVASGIPDLDVLLRLVGKKGPRYHRNVTHSMFVCGAIWAVVAMTVRMTGMDIPGSVLTAWLAALLAHPPLDYLTTGPRLGRVGYGIALWWPLTGRRYYSHRPVFAPDRDEATTVREYVKEAAEDLVRVGPLAAGIMIIAHLAL